MLVPIRLLETLTSSDQEGGRWETIWQPKQPDVVTVRNAQLKRTVVFTVNGKTMTMNGESRGIPVAPQKIDGRIMLPLRTAAEAFGQRIDWLDGLIVIGDKAFDPHSPETLAAKESIKKMLTDRRKPVNVDQPDTPLASYGASVFFIRYDYTSSALVEQLMVKTGGGNEKAVKLAGKPVLSSAKAIGDELYFVMEVEGRAELAAYHLGKGTVRLVAKIADWKPGDGWVTGIKQMGGELYVVLHYGEITMGSESLYKVDSGALKKVSSAKSYISYEKSGNFLYTTDFTPMFSVADNLYRVDLVKGTSSNIGKSGYAYGIDLSVTPGGGVGFSSVDALYVKDGSLFVLGYDNQNPDDRSAVYRINPADNSQVRVTPPTSRFWLKDDRILYIDASTGYLESVKHDGTDRRTLVQRKASNVTLLGGDLYYMELTGDNLFDVGHVYRYSLSDGKETKLSDRSAVAYYGNKNGVYLWADGYEPGIYRVESDGRNTRLVADSVAAVVPTDQGLLYTLTYQKGVFALK
ncbi:DUF5050 domain-containing protein [Paenibacillus methanolicus]|uniref:Copper amine oxidase-like protein n=1 Tax=Paenibacillus methanolicus TaxID=582686 RepID=A0A5S5CKU2_9BACL|nr:DUF5050 domain-containing protein [Paenibacillus methanolicus]TYP79161.1 copper amine oxidase-like protein [Paenibacillus methanolicus]